MEIEIHCQQILIIFSFRVFLCSTFQSCRKKSRHDCSFIQYQ